MESKLVLVIKTKVYWNSGKLNVIVCVVYKVPMFEDQYWNFHRLNWSMESIFEIIIRNYFYFNLTESFVLYLMYYLLFLCWKSFHFVKAHTQQRHHRMDNQRKRRCDVCAHSHSVLYVPFIKSTQRMNKWIM